MTGPIFQPADEPVGTIIVFGEGYYPPVLKVAPDDWVVYQTWWQEHIRDADTLFWVRSAASHRGCAAS